ncbi:MAG TPA: MarR family winged helix-turn-helix transcriptional regulator [Solirubrobacteraceae bacterium]|nr:MarR family winged helix-turn-helix transcriptional regulator [Solirubrobacteraceae bacterium]
MSTQTLDRTTAGTTVLLTRLARSVYRHLDEAELGMTYKQYVLLSVIGESDGTTQKQLSDVMGIDANMVVLMLNALEERGFAVRERDREDRRRHIVRITPAGRKAVVRAERALENVTDQLLGKLDGGERATLRTLLAKALGDGQFASSVIE